MKINRFLPLIILLIISQTACKTTTVTALEYYKSQLGVNYQDHQTVYTFSPDTSFKPSFTNDLDTFDLIFFDNLLFKLTNKGYELQHSQNLQNLRLKQCIISIEDKDSLVSAMMVCQSNLNKDSLFYAYTQMHQLGNNKGINVRNLSTALAHEVAKQIDSTHIQALRKKNPDLYGKTYQKTEVNGLGQTVILLLITFALLII